MITETIGLAGTFTIIRGMVITLTDIVTRQSLPGRVITQTLGSTSLPTGPESRSDWAFEAAQRAWNFFQDILTINNKENPTLFKPPPFLTPHRHDVGGVSFLASGFALTDLMARAISRYWEVCFFSIRKLLTGL